MTNTYLTETQLRNELSDLDAAKPTAKTDARKRALRQALNVYMSVPKLLIKAYKADASLVFEGHLEDLQLPSVPHGGGKETFSEALAQQVRLLHEVGFDAEDWNSRYAERTRKQLAEAGVQCNLTLRGAAAPSKPARKTKSQGRKLEVTRSTGPSPTRKGPKASPTELLLSEECKPLPEATLVKLEELNERFCAILTGRPDEIGFVKTDKGVKPSNGSAARGIPLKDDGTVEVHPCAGKILRTSQRSAEAVITACTYAFVANKIAHGLRRKTERRLFDGNKPEKAYVEYAMTFPSSVVNRALHQRLTLDESIQIGKMGGAANFVTNAATLLHRDSLESGVYFTKETALRYYLWSSRIAHSGPNKGEREPKPSEKRRTINAVVSLGWVPDFARRDKYPASVTEPNYVPLMLADDIAAATRLHLDRQHATAWNNLTDAHDELLDIVDAMIRALSDTPDND